MYPKIGRHTTKNGYKRVIKTKDTLFLKTYSEKRYNIQDSLFSSKKCKKREWKQNKIKTQQNRKKKERFMLRKPLNKIRYPFLRGPFAENPLPFKKLNRKAKKYSQLANKRGLAKKINDIENNLIETFAVTKKRNTVRKKSTVEDYKQIHNIIKPSSLNTFFLKDTKNKTNAVEIAKEGIQGCEKKKSLCREFSFEKKTRSLAAQGVRQSKYMFSLEQLKAEFSRKQKQHNKSSSFKILLEERKKCSIAYGCLNKKQMQKIFIQAKKFEGKFDENFIKIVESRLDVALFRICFFPTLFSARQWISHGHILVNNCVINLPAYQLKGGDIITVAPEKRDMVKRKISLFIAEKIKIRAFHYLVKINTFYGILKICIPCQKIDYPFRAVQTKVRKILLSFKKKFENLVNKNTKMRTKNITPYSNSGKNQAKDNKEGVHKQSRQRFAFFSLIPKVFLFFSKKKAENAQNKANKAARAACAAQLRKGYKGYAHENRDTRDTQLLPFLKVRNLFTLPRSLTQRMRALKISAIKPLNLEVCYKNMVAIFLYSPQKVALPVSIDLHYIAKSIQ